mmetsp:Transcript_52211/g.117278  ORF Transcript_52211/g.117278 Transcript_52211/m.117278 type:complete len:435 (-) Transcript_52211:398-1702(-)
MVAVRRHVRPRCDRRVLRGGHARRAMQLLKRVGKRGERRDRRRRGRAVVRLQHHPRTRDRVRPLEARGVVGGRPQRRRLVRGDAAVAEIEEVEDLGDVDGEVALVNVGPRKLTLAQEIRQRRDPLTEDAVRLDLLAEFARLGRDRRRIPDLYEERLQKVWQPEEAWVGVAELEAADTRLHARTLRQRFNLDWQPAGKLGVTDACALIVASQHRFPIASREHREIEAVGVVGRDDANIRHVPRYESVGGIDDLLGNDLAREIFLDEVLQPKEDDVIPLAVFRQILKHFLESARGEVGHIPTALERVVHGRAVLHLALVHVWKLDASVGFRQKQHLSLSRAELHHDHILLRAAVPQRLASPNDIGCFGLFSYANLGDGCRAVCDERNLVCARRVLDKAWHWEHFEDVNSRSAVGWREDNGRLVTLRAVRPRMPRHP